MSLDSVTSIQLLDLLCEGPIKGVVGGLKGVYLDETPVQNADGTYNFNKNYVGFYRRLGASVLTDNKQDSEFAYFDDSDGESTVIGINKEIGSNYDEELNSRNEVTKYKYGQGTLIRQVLNTDITGVTLLFTIPRLYSTAQEGLASGQLFNGTIKLEIWVQNIGGGGGYSLEETLIKEGISTTNYQFNSSLIKLKGSGPWNIKVKKVNLKEGHFAITYNDFEDISKKTSLKSGRANQVIWSSITESIRNSVSYSYSATAEMQLSSKIFEKIPKRAYLIRGRTVAIPEGAKVVYDSDDNAPDGYLAFDDDDFNNDVKRVDPDNPKSAIKEFWTTCPVCCFVDLLTNKRYGAGQFISMDDIDWYDLYPIAKYANQIVSNPDGTKEPRFACNVVIGSRADAYSVLRDMASVFRGMLFWSNNTIQVAADHGNLDGSDLPVSHVYSNSNVIGGAFEYSGSSLKTRSTSIRVRYSDPENLYKPGWVVVEDADLIAKYGYLVKEISAFGCTSKFQAQRVGRWALLTEKLAQDVVAFSTGLEGAVVRPGEVFAVADELRQGTRLSGRIASATTTVITADQDITLPSGSDPKLTVLMRDGSVVTAEIDSVSGSTITLKNALDDDPRDQAIWSITTSGVANQKFRCISVTDGGDGTFAITGVAHNDSIYAAVDSQEKIEVLDVTTYDSKPPKVTDIQFSAGQTTSNTTAKLQVDVSWSRGSSGATLSYEVKYSTTNKNFKTIQTTDPNFSITDLKAGDKLTVKIKGVGQGGNKKSTEASATFTVPSFSTSSAGTGTTTKKPETPKNVTLEVIG